MRTLALLLLLSVLSVQATLTVVQREPFQAVGTLDAGTPGSLGVVSQGTFYKRAVGPRVSGDTTANSLGWSADLRQVIGSGTRASHTQTIQATGAATLGSWSTFWYLGAVENNGANMVNLCQTKDNGGNYFVQVLLDSATGHFWYSRGGQWTDNDSGLAYPVRQWFELRQTWSLTSGSTYAFTLNYRLAGSSTWTTILSGGSFTFGGTIKEAQMPSNAANSTGRIRGRYGMPAVYSASSYATDATNLVSDVIDPSGPTNWYVNPSSGSDSNDGVTTSSAWQTVTQINTESANGGLFHASSYALGDTVVIDTSGAQLDISSTALAVLTPGLNIRATTGQWAVLKAHVAISDGAWSLVSGLTKVYSAASSALNATLWENDKWLTHPNGATLASITNSLQTTAGSFWTDGTTMYVHPFADTNPGSDGKTYDRSTTVTLNGAVQLNAANLNVQDLYIRKTCDTDKTTGIPNGGYSIAAGSVWQGTNRIGHCYTDYFGKHGIGLVANSASGEYTLIDGCEAEQGSPYGSQTPFVSFCGTSTTGITHVYSNCVVTADTGVVGSTAGMSGAASAFYSHNSSGYGQFASISLISCNFNQATIGGTDAIVSLTATNCVLGGDNGTGAAVKRFDRCWMTRVPPNQNVSTGSQRVANCVFALTNNVVTWNNTEGPLTGTNTIQGCTFDLRTRTASVNFPAVQIRGGTVTFTNRDNVYLFPVYTGAGATDWVPYRDFTNSDTIISQNNVIQNNGQSYVSYNYRGTNDTFSAWQALGFDANSLTNEPALRTDYRPHPWSKTRNAGVDLGPLVDYTGKTFQVRKQIGAYEWQVMSPQFQMGVR